MSISRLSHYRLVSNIWRISLFTRCNVQWSFLRWEANEISLGEGGLSRGRSSAALPSRSDFTELVTNYQASYTMTGFLLSLAICGYSTRSRNSKLDLLLYVLSSNCPHDCAASGYKISPAIRHFPAIDWSHDWNGRGMWCYVSTFNTKRRTIYFNCILSKSIKKIW